MADTLTAVVGALKGLGVSGPFAAIAFAGHPMVAVITGLIALAVYLLAPVARHARQWLDTTVGKKLGTLRPGPPDGRWPRKPDEDCRWSGASSFHGQAEAPPAAALAVLLLRARRSDE